jgi:hypothetical protein
LEEVNAERFSFALSAQIGISFSARAVLSVSPQRIARWIDDNLRVDVRAPADSADS